MNINLDLSRVQSYSTALSAKLCNSYFADKEIINGEQILSFTPVQQLNLLIIKALFERWKEELQKLRSPYFNYDAEEVKDALSGFMNTLSQNISISKDFFSPLVQKAIYDTVIVCSSPSDHLLQELSNKTSIAKPSLLDKLKYYKVYPGFFRSFHEQVKGITEEEVSGASLRKIVSALDKPTIEEIHEAEEVLNGMSLLLKFDPLDFNSVAVSSSAEVQNTNKPFGNSSKKTPSENKAKGDVLNQQFGERQLSINDALKPSQETSIADRFSKSKIEDIKSSIPLNLKFLFINILFDGNSVDYACALNEIEQTDSIDKAKGVLNDTYASKYSWDKHPEEAEEFLKIIERKFY